jgi:hypothetical protein
VEIDRQAIERRDFPIARRGYETAAVDAHLRALAAEIEELQRSQPGEREPTLATAASTQVQGILAAAETAAADIEREAREDAASERGDAERDAARTREQAIQQARAHVAAVAQATAVLLERVGSLDGEVGQLVERVRAGANRLAGDLATVETNMGELYDAAGGAHASAPSGDASAPETPARRTAPVAATVPGAGRRPGEQGAETGAPSREPTSIGVDGPAPPAAAPRAVEQRGGDEEDVEGARLIALNMALNGDSRADADRYLAENFTLSEREKLIDEVYASIEG